MFKDDSGQSPAAFVLSRIYIFDEKPGHLRPRLWWLKSVFKSKYDLVLALSKCFFVAPKSNRTMSAALSQHKIENGSHGSCKVSGSVCGDQNWYLNPNHDVFLNYDQVFFFVLKPDQRVSKAFDEKRKETEVKKCTVRKRTWVLYWHFSCAGLLLTCCCCYLIWESSG